MSATVKKPKLDWHGIVSALHRRGMTLTKLAELNNLPESACRKAKTIPYRKAEAAIASFLGMKVEELWPDRYPVKKSRILDSKYEGSLESQKSALAADIRAAA